MPAGWPGYVRHIPHSDRALPEPLPAFSRILSKACVQALDRQHVRSTQVSLKPAVGAIMPHCWPALAKATNRKPVLAAQCRR